MNTEYKKEVSYNGFSIDKLKEGLKSDDFNIGIYCLIEFDLFNCKRLRSYMINRLIVMMSEEVSIGTWWLPIRVKELYDEITKCPDNKQLLVTLYETIFECKGCYILKEYLPKTELKLVEINKKEVLNEFEIYLKDKNKLVFEKLSLLLPHPRIGISIWVIIKKYLQPELYESLHFLYCKMVHKEKVYYLYHGILLIILKEEINWDSIKKSKLSDLDVKELYNINLNKKINL